jgi:hypothetical protein
MPGKTARKTVFASDSTDTTPSSAESTFSSISSTPSTSSQDEHSQQINFNKRIELAHRDIASAAEAEARLKEIDTLIKELDNNKKEQTILLNQQELAAKKEHLLKLRLKLKKWFNRDATAGSLAAIAITALYTGVEKVGNFLPPGIANFIMPFFIIADVASAVSAWKIALLNRELKREENQAAGRSSWVGSRNSLLRAIFETVWATVGSAIVTGAIITSTFLASAVAGAFAVYIAPVFMLVLGTRTIFNAASSLFHLIRAHRAQVNANKPENAADKEKFEALAVHYKRVAKIQATAAATSAIGFVATTLVMLTHHFSFGFVGIIGGVALGGFMTYLFRGNSKFSSGLKVENKTITQETKSLSNKLNTLELEQKQKSQKLVGFLPNFVELVKKAGKFALPVPVSAPQAINPSTSKEQDAPASSYRKIKFDIIERDKTKDKNPEETPDMTVKITSKSESGSHSVKIPVNSNDGTVATKTKRFGFYASPRADATDESENHAPKMRQKS